MTMEAFIALSGVVLGWILGTATQALRDRRSARIALMLIHNELLGDIAQLDLAASEGDAEAVPAPSHWYRRWKLSRAAWDQQGSIAMLRLEGDDAWKVYEAYHALDASQLLLDGTREGVVALGEAVGNLADPSVRAANPAAAAQFLSADADSREGLRNQLAALHAAHAVLDRHLGISHRTNG